MKVGEEVKVKRLVNGLYQIEITNWLGAYIGGAASTALTLNQLVFKDEASGDMLGATEAKAG